MKTNLFRIFLLGGVLSVCLYMGCTRLNSQSSSSQQSWEIAALLGRNEFLGTANEQQIVTQQYHELRHKILEKADDWGSYLQLAQLFMIEARITGEHGYYYPAALSLIDRTLDYASDEDFQFQASFLKATVLLSLHRFDEALPYAQKALSLNPHHALTYGALVDAHVELGNYQQAIEWAEKMVQLRPDLRSYSRISYLRELSGDIEGAVSAMQMALEAGVPGQEDRAWCRTTLGEIHLKYGNLPAAEKQFYLALKERPNYPFALAGRAEVLHLEGANKEALAYLDSAIQLIPELGFYIQQAKIYKELGQTDRFTQLQVSIMEMFRDDEEKGHLMYIERARYFREVWEDDSISFEYIRKTLKNRPQNKEVAHLAAGMHYKLGAYDRAQDYAAVSIRGGCVDPEYLGLLGMILIKKGKLNEGRVYLKNSLKANPFQSYFFTNELKEQVESLDRRNEKMGAKKS